MVRSFVGLGSNVGDRLGNLRRALDELRSSDGIEVGRLSSVYDTDPVGPPQPNFLNAVAEVQTSLGARELLAVLKSIEERLGRSDGRRWGPREIDLDLLLYGDEEIAEKDLTIPHPEIADRAFVLVPLAELAGDIYIPGRGTASELMAVLGSAGVRLEGSSASLALDDGRKD